MRRWRWLAGVAVGIAAIVAARACWPELPDPLPRATRSHAGRLLDGAAIDDESADERDAAELEADRSPEASAPVPAGAMRYRMKFVKADGQSLTTARIGVRPEGATEPRTITPTSRGAAVLDLDDGCRAVDFSAHGYVDVHRAIDARDRRSGDLGAIALVPAATLDVRIVGAPHRATPWLAISTWAKTEVRYDQVGFGIAKLATADGTGHATFALPSDTEIWLEVGGSGVALVSTPPPLAAGVTTWTVDLAAFARIRGHVAGVPPSCARGAVVWLKRFVPEEDGLFPGLDARTELDEEARFEFLAVPDGPFALHLDFAGLRASGDARRDTWRTADLPSGRDLELEPDCELLGVSIGPLAENRESASGANLRFDGPTRTLVTLRAADDRRSCRGIVAASVLREAKSLRVDAGTGWERELDVSALPPPHDGVVTIDVDRFPRPGCRLWVEWNWFASRDWRIELAESGRSVGDPDVPVAKRERGLIDVRFEGLAPGRYDVWGVYRSVLQRRVASGIDLGPDEVRSLDVKLPSPVHRAGSITNWSELDPAMRPQEVVFENATTATIVDGRFETDVAPPIGRTARFNDVHGDRVDATAPVEADEDDALAVAFPVGDLELFQMSVQAPNDGRTVACCPGADVPETLSMFTEFRRSFADKDGRISFVRRRGALLHGWIVSLTARGEERVLAWFSSDVPAGTFVPAGRHVDVTNGTDGTTATLVLVARPLGGWTPPRFPLCKVIHGLPRRIWIPDGAEFVDVEFPGRAKKRVECATLAEKWMIGTE